MNLFKTSIVFSRYRDSHTSLFVPIFVRYIVIAFGLLLKKNGTLQTHFHSRVSLFLVEKGFISTSSSPRKKEYSWELTHQFWKLSATPWKIEVHLQRIFWFCHQLVIPKTPTQAGKTRRKSSRKVNKKFNVYVFIYPSKRYKKEIIRRNQSEILDEYFNLGFVIAYAEHNLPKYWITFSLVYIFSATTA